MNIKDYLKSIHMTQKELADRLGLSRPTLDSYIHLFESGISLPKDKYQVVFEQLFIEPARSEQGFRKALDDYAIFLKQDQVLGTTEMDTEKSYIMSLVIGAIKKDLFRDDADKDIYVFINLLLHNYRKNPTLKQMIEYFLLLYSRKNVSDISENDKVFLSNFHDIIQNKDNLMFQKQAFQDLVEYANKTKQVNALLKTEIQQQIMDRIESKMQQLTEAGIEINPDEFDVTSILKL